MICATEVILQIVHLIWNSPLNGLIYILRLALDHINHTAATVLLLISKDY